MRTVATALAVVVALSGCGGGSSSEPQRVKEVVHAFLEQQADGKGKEACKFLTGPARTELVTAVARRAPRSLPRPKTCDDAVAIVHAAAKKSLLDALRSADITDVHVHGDKASAVVQDHATFKPQHVTLKKKSSHMGRPWTIDGAPHLGS